jgi:hypothetical protein
VKKTKNHTRGLSVENGWPLNNEDTGNQNKHQSPITNQSPFSSSDHRKNPNRFVLSSPFPQDNNKQRILIFSPLSIIVKVALLYKTTTTDKTLS